MATRKIKDAKDLTTNELIYFKGHAQATYMSDGRTVEEAISSSTGGESTTKEVVWVDGDTIDLLEPNKIYLFSTIRTSLQISEIVYPDGYHAEYCIMSNGAGFGGEGSSISLIFPDNISIYWVGDDISSISNADIWELSIVYTESPTDSCFKCVLTKFT